MTKYSLLLLISLFAFKGYSQAVHIDSIKWIAKDLGYLRFYKDELTFNLDGHEQFKRFKIVKDSLIMVDTYTSSRDNFKKVFVDNFKFLIGQIDSNSLTLVPIDSNAFKIANKRQYQFDNLLYKTDKHLKFERLTFNSGFCYGRCPVLTIEIDSRGNYYLLGGEYADPFKGSFKGKLSVKQLSDLKYILSYSRLDLMYKWKQGNAVMDAPNYTISILSNNKPLRIETNEPPLNIVDLIDFLLNSYKRISLTKDNSNFKFDK